MATVKTNKTATEKSKNAPLKGENIMKKLLTLVMTAVLGIACVFGMTACGGTNNENGEQKTFTVLTNCPFAPFEYTENGKIYGIDMEIAAGFAKENNYKLVIKNIDFDAIESQVGAGYGDIGMAGMSITPERLASYAFSTEYYSASQVLLVKADDTSFDACKTKEDVDAVLKTKAKLGAQSGTTGFSYIVDEDCLGLEQSKQKGYEDGQTAAMDLTNGNVDVVIIDEAPAKALQANMKGLKVIDIKLTDEKYAFLIKKDNTELVESMNNYLAKIKANGDFDKIVNKYNGGEGEKIGYSFVDENN